MSDLTHFDEHGVSRMVDVGSKPLSERTARASARVKLSSGTATMIRDKSVAKGDVFEVARLAAIMAAKRTGELIPLCHPLPLTAIFVDMTWDENDVLIDAVVKTVARTGVEMEAMTAASVAALTIYDMVKAVDREVVITDIRLEEKTGGVHGPFRRSD